MKIGLLSDTHGTVDPSIFEHFKDCDEIWHAGDIGNQEVSDLLSKFKPFKAVYGNIDGGIVKTTYPEKLIFECEGFKILIIHIGGYPPKYNPTVKKLLLSESPDIVICGHSHILRVMRDPEREILYLNPGAAGKEGFHKIKTLLKFELKDKKIMNMQVVELGKRGAIS